LLYSYKSRLFAWECSAVVEVVLEEKVKTLCYNLRPPCSVFLVDHAWTYRVESARQQLQEIPGLLPRMAALMGLPAAHGETSDTETPDLDPDRVQLVLEEMWRYNQTYRLAQGVGGNADTSQRTEECRSGRFSLSLSHSLSHSLIVCRWFRGLYLKLNYI